MTYPERWNCPSCGAVIKRRDKCSECSFPELWKCPKCGKTIRSSQVCDNCGFDSRYPERRGKIISKKEKKELRNLGIISIVVFWIIIVIGIVFYVNFNDRIYYQGATVSNMSFNLMFRTLWGAERVSAGFIGPEENVKNYTAEYNSSSDLWIIEDISLDKVGFWTVIIEKQTEEDVSTIKDEIFIGIECSLDKHCGEEEECHHGECVETEPGPLDFLREMGLI